MNGWTEVFYDIETQSFFLYKEASMY